jgi:formate--tetrahydrofolate ligase
MVRNVTEVASSLGLSANEIAQVGRGVAKVPVSVVRARTGQRKGKLVLVTAMTPTSAGEGKTVTTIGTAMALCKQGHLAVACLRQPSLGPVFGLKGGATGGGKATVEPSQDINLGFTGDLYAVATAQDLLASLIDNHLHYGNSRKLDLERITLPRTIDLDDRSLRQVRVGLGGPGTAPERRDRFVIAAASEVAAIHCLSKDAEDLVRRLNRIVVGFDTGGLPVTAQDLEGGGAMAAILRHAIEPNLVQTCEGTPAFVHAGPFANLGPGTASVMSIRLALSLADYVLVEAGFASDLGGEKFIDLVGPMGGFTPDAAILVVTVSALRHHARSDPTQPIVTGPEAMRRGLANVTRHVAHLKEHGLDPVIAINQHPKDEPAELAAVEEYCHSQGLRYALYTAFARGSEGGLALATMVKEAISHGHPAKPIIDAAAPIPEKIERISRLAYGADGSTLMPDAAKGLGDLAAVGLDHGPLCMAKTHLSLSDDSKKLGAPTGFTVSVHRLAPWTGAGFTVAYLGAILAMPGLPERPAAARISITADGTVSGLD